MARSRSVSGNNLFHVASSNKQLSLNINAGKDEEDDPKEIAKKNGMLLLLSYYEYYY